jgi:hypothetical protein
VFPQCSSSNLTFFGHPNIQFYGPASSERFLFGCRLRPVRVSGIAEHGGSESGTIVNRQFIYLPGVSERMADKYEVYSWSIPLSKQPRDGRGQEPVNSTGHM